jgi:hypothetical protein
MAPATSPAAAPRRGASGPRARAIARRARALLVLAAAAVLVVALAAAPGKALAAGNGSGATTAPGDHNPLTKTEQHYIDETLKMLTMERPDDAAKIVVDLLKKYAAPTGATVPGCLVSGAASRTFRRLPLPSTTKWSSFFAQLDACRRAPTLARTAACVQSSFEGFGLATPSAQRDFVQLFYCEMICTDQGEGCDGGKDCQVVTRFDQCAKSPAAKKNANKPTALVTAAEGALGRGAASAAKASSYYYLDSGR